jgi:alkylation response protein AidB-like acyl-CoA dehydrogenase
VKRGNGTLMDDPSFRSRLAKLEIDLQALEFTELRSLASAAAGKQPGPESSILKLKGTEIQQRIAHLTTVAAGPYATAYGGVKAGPGFAKGGTSGYLSSRYYSIYGGASEVQKDIIAKNVLGIRTKGTSN